MINPAQNHLTDFYPALVHAIERRIFAVRQLHQLRGGTVSPIDPKIPVLRAHSKIHAVATNVSDPVLKEWRKMDHTAETRSAKLMATGSGASEKAQAKGGIINCDTTVRNRTLQLRFSLGIGEVSRSTIQLVRPLPDFFCDRPLNRSISRQKAGDEIARLLNSSIAYEIEHPGGRFAVGFFRQRH